MLPFLHVTHRIAFSVVRIDQKSVTTITPSSTATTDGYLVAVEVGSADTPGAIMLVSTVVRVGERMFHVLIGCASLVHPSLRVPAEDDTVRTRVPPHVVECPQLLCRHVF